MIVLVAVFLSLIVSVATPIRYRSTAELLVVQRGIFSRDPFVASRSTEYLSQVLAEVVGSRSFLESVRQTNPEVLAGLPEEPNREKRAWNKRVKAHVVRDTGVLKLSAYDRSRDRASALADTVVITLLAKSNDYHGEGDAVSIRVLESPLTTRYPASPNIARNVVVALVAGLLAALGFLYLWPEAHFTLSSRALFPLSSRAKSRDLAGRHHKRLFDWHVPGETAEAALERIVQADSLSEVEGPPTVIPSQTPVIPSPSYVIPSQAEGSRPAHTDHAAHSNLLPPTSNLPTVFEHMVGRLQ